jgi:DNA-binding NarL/FixJ family response regulator
MRSLTVMIQQPLARHGEKMGQRGPVAVLLIGEDLQLLASRLRRAGEREGWLHIQGLAATPVEATRAARREPPDLVLCDASLADGAAYELAHFFALRLPETVIGFVGEAPSDDNTLLEAIRLGVAAYIPPTCDEPGLLSLIRSLIDGAHPIDMDATQRPGVAQWVFAHFRAAMMGEIASGASAAGRMPAGPWRADRTPMTTAPLSFREIEVLELAARGQSNKRIARRLGISDQTVKNHVTAILRKLEANDRTEAVVQAIGHGWIRLEQASPPRLQRLAS